MAALKEFANFITLNMANLVTTYARLLAEGGQGYEVLPANSRTASGRRLLKAVVEAFELESATPLIDIFNKDLTDNKPPDAASGASSAQRSGNITPPNPLLEVECLGQTLTPVVTNLEAGKFLWQILSESRATVLHGGIDVTGASQKIEVPRQAATALGEEETFYQSLIDALPQNIYRVDRAGRITFGNKAYLNTLGMTLEECLGKTAYDLFPKELADKYTADDKRVIDSGEEIDSVESNRVPATGQTIYVQVIKTPVRNSAGGIVGLQSTFWDVTERKEMEDKLGKRVRELNCLNEIGREMEEAPSVAELLQWVTERIPPAMNYPELCQTAIEFDGNVYGLAEAIDLPAQMTHGLYIKGKVLGRVYIAYTEKQDFLDEESAMLGAIATRLSGYIENRRLLEETEATLADMQQSQEMLETVINATPDWIFIKDRDHRYQLANRAYADSMKISPGEFIGKNDLELGFPEDIVKGNPEKGIRGFWPDDLEVMESGQTKIIDVEPAEVDGQPVYLSTIKAPLRDSEGNVWAVLGYVRDITERELLLARMEQRARREQTIREITDKMRAAASLEQLIKTATEELGERLSAGHALVELGLTGTVTEGLQPNGAGSDGPAIGEEQ